MKDDIHILHEFLEYLKDETEVPIEYIDRVQAVVNQTILDIVKYKAMTKAAKECIDSGGWGIDEFGHSYLAIDKELIDALDAVMERHGDTLKKLGDDNEE